MHPLTRRDFLQAGAGAAAATLATSALASTKPAQPKRPNILMIAVDDLRPQLNCYGHKQMISPSIDKLASEGTQFDRAYCQVPVCGASRASLLKGLRPTFNRFLGYSTWADKDAGKFTSLPLHFKNHGYITLSRGKIYHHRNDDLKAWSDKPWRIRDFRAYLTDESKKIMSENPKGRHGAQGPAYEAADVADSAYPDGKCADQLIDDLRRLKKQDKPWFIAGGFAKPHLPFNCPKKYWDMYKREKIDLADNPFRPKGAPDVALHNWGELRAYYGIPKRGKLSDDMARTLIHGYYACVSYIDAQIGRVLAELDKLGLRDNTIVILWGDHGWQLGEHGLWCKHANFETSLHCPLLVRAPGYEAKQHSKALVEYIDIYPTLCELAGLPLPQHLDGKSFVPLMKQPDKQWKEAAYSRYYKGDSIRTDRYRYTIFRAKPDEQPFAKMLYDHDKDPQENINVADKPEYAETVKKLESMLAKMG